MRYGVCEWETGYCDIFCNSKEVRATVKHYMIYCHITEYPLSIICHFLEYTGVDTTEICEIDEQSEKGYRTC